MDKLNARQPTTGASGTSTGTSQQAAFDRWRNTPGYQFKLEEDTRALQNSAAARGGLFSGAAGKAITRYASGLADQTYGNHMNQLAALSGVGQTQTNQNAAYGQSVATNMGNNLMAAGQARASGLQQRADAYSQGAAALGGAFNRYWQGQQNWAGGGFGY